MKLDAQKLFFPLTIAAAVIGIWAAFRKQDGTTAVILPNPASSGVTPSADVAPYTFDTPQLASPPSNTQALANPWSNNPGGSQVYNFDIPGLTTQIPANAAVAKMDSTGEGTRTSVPDPTTSSHPIPGYLTSNFGPRHALTKPMPVPQSPAGSCGCGGSCGMPSPSCNTCNQSNAYPDGSGDTKLVSSRALQLVNSQPEEWLGAYAANAASYVASDPPDTNGWAAEYK